VSEVLTGNSDRGAPASRRATRIKMQALARHLANRFVRCWPQHQDLPALRLLATASGGGE